MNQPHKLTKGTSLERSRLQAELVKNILPFWIEHMVDHENGGFHGAITQQMEIRDDVPRSAILCARLLWTYASAYRLFGKHAYLEMAEHAYAALTQTFWDPQFEGVYWSVNAAGQPVMDRKHSYTQAFAIYGLSEFYRASQTLRLRSESLTHAQRLFELLEAHAYEPNYGGYLEGCSREWGELADTRLSSKEPQCRKSMNTLLHILESYTNLLRVWEDPKLRQRLAELIGLFLEKVIHPHTHHFHLFFEDDWTVLGDQISFGHDIEGSWLLVEAAEALADRFLILQTRREAVAMAHAVYRQGLDSDGSLLHEASPRGIENDQKHWWAQAEALVGFSNAAQICGAPQFKRAAERLWDYIEEKFVDRQHGEWRKELDRQGNPLEGSYKAGPWECPYHQSRALMEMLARLPEAKKHSG